MEEIYRKEIQNDFRIELKAHWQPAWKAIIEKAQIHYPLYMNCYVEALNAILEGIDRYRREKEQDGRTDPRSYYKKSDYSEEVFYNLNHVNNIIAFIGGRGSGKTSAVNEFTNIISTFQEDYSIWEKQLSDAARMKEWDRKQFIVLNPIDASALEAEENIIELIWANMYERYEKELHELRFIGKGQDPETWKMNLIREFDEVYTNYSLLSCGKEKSYVGESVLAKLKNMPSSLKVCRIFAELLENYFKMFAGERNTEQYLVITIDDLDLHMRKGYAMLDQLHKFLSHPNIIILLALDFKQISLLCQNYFERNLILPRSSMEQSVIQHSQDLCNDYLLKVLPINNRVYMPDKKLFSQDAIITQGHDRLDMKRFILHKIARKTNIYYDGNGVKRHFAVPRTIREFVTYNAFLDSMYDVEMSEEDGSPETKEERIQHYDMNHEQFNSDISMRMAYQILDSEQRRELERMFERNLARRPQYTLDRCYELLDISDDEDRRYCYGNLLECIYKLGRNNNKYKKLVHCVLASFTSEMTREYINYRRNPDIDERDKSLNNLKQFIGMSIAGKWLGDIVPMALEKKEQLVTIHDSYGFIEAAKLNQAELDYILMPNNVISNEIMPINLVERILNELANTKIIPMWRCILMLCGEYEVSGSKLRRQAPEIIFLFDRENEDKAIKIGIRIAAECCFDIFGFIGKTIDSLENEMISESMKKGLLEGLRALITNIYGRDTRDRVLDKTKKLVTRKWEHIYKTKSINKMTDVAFPFYNLDLAYNVLKRVRRDCRDNLERRIPLYKLYDYMKKVYGYVAYELYQEDIFYKQEEKGFTYQFINCEFIRMFGIKMPEIFKSNYFEREYGMLPEEFARTLGDVISVLKLEDPYSTVE